MVGHRCAYLWNAERHNRPKIFARSNRVNEPMEHEYRSTIRDMRAEAILGVIQPQIAEAKLTERWPSVTAYLGGAPARLGAHIQLVARGIIRWALRLPFWLSVLVMILALPLATLIALAAWLLLAPFFFLRLLPVTATRYVLTNKAIKVLKGWSGRVVEELPLSEIDTEPGGDFPRVAVRIVENSIQPFYQAADLEIVSRGQVKLVLRGVKEYEQFRRSIENAWFAFGRKDMPKEQIHPASEAETKK
ncbi:hypothetical protein HRbin36_02011 [bacterium HR36]|nr:hypothetical protein HRbin36_02011 [bacterium HR36]